MVDMAIIADSPDGENLDRVQALLNQALGCAVPMVFLTYNSRRLDEENGCAHCLNKPFVPDQLCDKILEVVREQPATHRASSVAPLPGADRPGLGLDVLVAEDNVIAAKVIATFLSKLGHRVALAKNGEESLERVRGRRFDIAFIDLRMPKIDGLEFTRAYRAEETADRRLPIIALTANAAEEMRQETLEAGMDDFLTKPVAPEELDEIIRRYRPVAA